ncbi:50S ribosomal protein L11 methyltransferase [Lichenicoccus sp.]|uniref:50S ribosomal protein L11 methyltransferase n=1 Tax=Lichenicoccus sp. TaxID=2781899 RepID=UPI003D0AE1F0
MSPRRATALETIHVTVPEAAVEDYERAIASVCAAIGLFEADDTQTCWRIEGVKTEGADEAALADALSIAAHLSGHSAALLRQRTETEGWLARTAEAFPEQRIGRRFTIRGTHLAPAPGPGLTLTLDAGIAFGSGEHGSTRGCLRALEFMAHRAPRRILDLGTGSGILAMAAAALLKRPVLAIDIEPWSVRVAAQNARLNELHTRVLCRLGNGWSSPAIRAAAPFDLVFANILARPLCRMAAPLAANLASGGTAILAGLLSSQVRQVLAAHRRQGLVLERQLREGDWATLVLRRR